MKKNKPLGIKNYGSIPHLLTSKLGKGDHHIHEGQHRICTEKARDKHDVIIVQEKIDGSNVGVAKINGNIVAMTRSGYEAKTSPYEQHHYFDKWVKKRESMFHKLLRENERIVGEWILQACGIKYKIPVDREEDLFIAFDIFDSENNRMIHNDFVARLYNTSISYPFTFIDSVGRNYSIDKCYKEICDVPNHLRHCPIVDGQLPEGLIYRVERKGKFDFIAKWVRADFNTGQYLPEISGNDTVWNFPPNRI